MSRHCPHCNTPRLDELPVFCNSQCEGMYSKWLKQGATSKICITSIIKLRKQAATWFKLLAKECKHHKDPLCLSRDEKLPPKGIVFCKVENCPLVK